MLISEPALSEFHDYPSWGRFTISRISKVLLYKYNIHMEHNFSSGTTPKNEVVRSSSKLDQLESYRMVLTLVDPVEKKKRSENTLTVLWLFSDNSDLELLWLSLKAVQWFTIGGTSPPSRFIIGWCEKQLLFTSLLPMANPDGVDVPPIVNHCTTFNDRYTMFFYFLLLKNKIIVFVFIPANSNFCHKYIQILKNLESFCGKKKLLTALGFEPRSLKFLSLPTLSEDH